jgi:hypothetical protein
MDSGIRPAFFRMRSSDPPSIYSMQILISPSLKEHNHSAAPGQKAGKTHKTGVKRIMNSFKTSVKLNQYNKHQNNNPDLHITQAADFASNISVSKEFCSP